MTVSRRTFVSGVSTAASLAAAGFLGELRTEAAEEKTTEVAPARILFNENPLGPSPKALSAISNAAQQFARYPLGKSKVLEMRLRELNGLPFATPEPGLSLRPAPAPEGTHGLLLGVGSSEILKAAAWAYCSTEGSVVEPYPSYAAIGNAASSIPGAKIERRMVPLNSENCIDVQATIDAIDSSTKMLVICNPNNPTGTTIPAEQIEAMANAAPKDALVFIDEAYIEFADGGTKSSALDFAKTRSNVIIARTFSKIYGLAGLRVGYGIGHQSIMDRLKPYMLGGLSHSMPGILGAIAAVDDDAHLSESLAHNEKIHATWKKSFHDLGWKMTPSVTCFCWLDVGHDCASLVGFLRDRGVLISGGQRWELPNCVRISTGTEEENDRLLAGMKAYKAA